MVSSIHRNGLYVTIPLYFVLISCCAFWANKRQSQLQSAGITDKLSSHYLGGRQIGPLLTMGTIFASFYSGYTVVGIPTEAYTNGWMALRWVAAGNCIMMGYFGTALRLRKTALVRNHKTPLDFITDRFQSQLLRYTVFALQIIPSLLYITGQVVALKTTFNSIFDLDPDNIYPAIIIMAITLTFEWVGGLNCVAMTDFLQGCIMVFAYVSLSLILAKNFGGWKSLNPETYPRPDFYQTPTKDRQLDFWQFTVVTFCFFTLPHLMQRVYASRDLVSLKCGFAFVMGGVWYMMMVGVFIGTLGIQMLNGEEVSSPFSSILEKVMDLGGFPKFIGLIAVTGSLAAIMSTADSLLIAISQLVTEEVAYPMYPHASPSDMAWVGRCVSLAAAILACTMGLTWDKGIADLANINFALSFQCVFIFLMGLFSTKKTEFHPWCLAVGAITSSVYVFGFYFGYIKPTENSFCVSAGVSGFGLQLFVTFCMEGYRRMFLSSDEFDTQDEQRDLIFPYRPDWDIPKRSRFGDCALTPNLIWKMMDGIKEPLTNPWYGCFMAFTISLMTPIVPSGLPRNLADVAVINGTPWWVVKMLSIGLVATLVLLFNVFRMPNKYPNADERKMDPDVMELTPEELGYRVEYDTPNDLVARRRREILENLGMLPSEINDIVEASPETSVETDGERSHVQRDLELSISHDSTDNSSGRQHGGTQPRMNHHHHPQPADLDSLADLGTL